MKLAASLALGMAALSAAFSPVARFSPLLGLGRFPDRGREARAAIRFHPGAQQRHEAAKTSASSVVRCLASSASGSGASTSVERATEVRVQKKSCSPPLAVVFSSKPRHKHANAMRWRFDLALTETVALLHDLSCRWPMCALDCDAGHWKRVWW